MTVETVERILVIVVVSLQVYVFATTLIQIRVFRRIFPDVSYLKLSKVPIPVADLEKLRPKEILANINQYKKKLEPDPGGLAEDSLFADSSYGHKTDTVKVNIIECDELPNAVFANILFSVNNYLIRNRATTTDFHLIKDIVERNTEMVEDDINLTIAIPLYLGLMGTMLGIVIGLFNMPDLSVIVGTGAKDIMLNEGIALLIGGVKIAMIASFSGLLLTIYNSGWAFKGSKVWNEGRKNEFYTFVQVELLPVVNQGLASTLESLQRNLLKFNNEFTTNLSQLSGIFDSNTRTIMAQKELLDAIDKTKVAEMGKYNLKVLQQLDVSVIHLEKFNSYLANISEFAESSKQLANCTNELLKRTDNFKVLADKVESKLDQGRNLLEFLSGHFQKLEDHKKFTANAVADVGHSISNTFKELKTHIQASSEAVKKFTVDEVEALKKALSESKTNLSNLEHLATLKADVSLFKDSTASQGERIRQLVNDVNRNMEMSIAMLEKIQNNNLISRIKSTGRSIMNLFKPKK